MLPPYLSKAQPNPPSNRAPWYVNTAPSYAGVFLWIAFYQSISQGTLDKAGVAGSLLALAVSGLLSFGLFYYVPAMLGMQTGYPLYVVGSSTFGTTGGYLMPGLLMGLLQIGWFAVVAFFAPRFILTGIGMDPAVGSPAFIITAVLWGYTMAYIGVKGIQYVARAALFLNLIPFLMLLLVFSQNKDGISKYTPPTPDSYAGFTTMIQIVIGFFATAGAAGTDFGMNARNQSDVKWGGIVGVGLAILYAGGLPLMSVAGAHGLNPSLTSLNYEGAITASGGMLASAMFLLFALASVTSACFCAFIAGNSFATMIPGVPRLGSTMAGVTVAIILAVTGAAENLIGFFSIVGASFGPICGAMAADYLLSGRKWPGPREGINWAGYISWAIGFAIGIWGGVQPAVVYSFIAGFVVYAILAKMGLEPKTVRMLPAAAGAR